MVFYRRLTGFNLSLKEVSLYRKEGVILKGIMLQGTASNVGKSLLATAFCRLFSDDGFSVAPFKAQNMTHNFRVLDHGKKLATSQVIQAEAARIEPSTWMNPILLTIGSNSRSDIVLFGKTVGTLDGLSNGELHKKWLGTIRDALFQLNKSYDLLVLEGAGSPVELNLQESDVANMKTAKLADVPVLLVADVNRGGVFASLIGTLELLKPEERERVTGIIINKFQGDVALFQDGVRLIEERTGIPVFGVIPYVKHDIEDEDALTSIENPNQYHFSSLPSDEQIDHFAQTVKEHIDWPRIKQMVSEWNR